MASRKGRAVQLGVIMGSRVPDHVHALFIGLVHETVGVTERLLTLQAAPQSSPMDTHTCEQKA